jgi:hypothetical protein
MLISKDRLQKALRVSGIHLIVSVLIALLSAALVFGVWYPYPYREIMGGRELFFLIVMVDVVCGPLLTLVLYNPTKSRLELTCDLGIVGALQCLALLYGLYTVVLARPVYMVYEVDRFHIVSAIDIDSTELSKAKPPWNKLPFWGPLLIAAREPQNPTEKLESLQLSFKGKEPSARPDWWEDYSSSTATVLTRAKPISELRAKRPAEVKLIDQAVADSAKLETDLKYLPMTSFKSTGWVVFLDAKTAFPLAYAPIDGF